MADAGGVPRTRDALRARLDELGVRHNVYHLFGSRMFEGFVMDHRPDGWSVLYTERGRDSEVAWYGSEAEACADMLARLVRDEHDVFALVAGPAPVSEAEAAFESWCTARGATRESLPPQDWKFDDVPGLNTSLRRVFVRTTAVRLLDRFLKS